VKLAIPHRYRFGPDRPVVGAVLGGEDAWDALRLQTDGPFALPATRAAWEAMATDPVNTARAAALHRHLGDVRAVASYGVGTASVELALARLDPGRRLVVTEFAPATVDRLAVLFPEAEVIRHDLRVGAPVPLVDVHLLQRVDTELDDPGFEDLLQRFSSVRLIVLATELLGLRPLLREAFTLVRGGSTRAGLVRSRGAFEALWRETHTARPLAVHDLSGWLLEPRR
jgi:hypothetical protein